MTQSERDLGLHVPEVEREFLGMLLDDATLPAHLADNLLEDSATALQPSDIDRPVYRAAYEAMLALATEGVRPDTLMVTERMRGLDYDLSAIWSATTAVQYLGDRGRFSALVERIRTASARRQTLAVNQELAQLAVDPQVTPAELATRAIARYRELEVPYTREPALVEQVHAYRTQLDEWRENPNGLRGITTGVRALDRLTHGLKRGDVTVIGGRTSTGKTAMLLHVVLSAARACPPGHHVGVISLEMQTSPLIHRLVASMSGVEATALEAGVLPEDEWDRVDAATLELEALPLRILDAFTAVKRTNGARGVMSPAEIRRRLLMWRRDGVLDLVAVDYLQLLRVETEKARLPRDERVNDNIQALHELAVEFQTPMLVLSQLSRETERRANHLPTVADLSEGGGIEQTADTIWLLYRADYYRDQGLEVAEGMDRPDGVMDVLIPKNRNGGTGRTQVFFDRRCQRIADYDARREAPVDYQGVVIPRVVEQGALHQGRIV